MKSRCLCHWERALFSWRKQEERGNAESLESKGQALLSRISIGKPIKFKHFTRKGYALFACLGKEVLIGTLSVATLTYAKADGISTDVERASKSLQNGRETVNAQTDARQNPDEGVIQLRCQETDKADNSVVSKETNETTVPDKTDDIISPIETDDAAVPKDTVQSMSERSIMLDEVDITGSRVPLPKANAVRMVTVLSEDKLQNMPSQSVNDALKNVVGVDVRQRGALGAQTDIGIRGGTSEHVALLLDGINICDPQTAHNGLDLPVDLSDVKQIVVTEGPAGRVYGTSSLAGAINVQTNGLGKNELIIRAEGGSFGYAVGGLRLSLSKGNWSNSISSSYTRSDGFSRSKAGKLNSDYQGIKAFYQGRYDDKKVLVSWHAGMSLRGWGSNTFYGISSDEQYEHTNKIYTALHAETKTGHFHFSPTIYWNRFSDRFEYFRNAPEKSPYNYNRMDIMGMNLNSYFDWILGRTSIGAECRNEDLKSGNLGEPLSTPIPIHGTGREYNLGLNRTNLSISLEHNVHLSWLDVSAGFVAIKNTWNEMPMKIYPGIDVGISPIDCLRIFASYNTSLRMPTYTELYYSVDGHKADKHLKPEEMSAFEFGIRYMSNGIQAQLSLYRHAGKNMIDWIMDTTHGEEAVWESVNHAHITSLGTEASVNFDFFQLFPTQKVLRNLNIAYSYIDQNQKREPNIQSLYALEYLRHKFTASLQLQIIRDLNFNINCRYQQRIGSYTDVNAESKDYKPYFITDARLSWDKNMYNIYAEANNIFNKTYIDYGNVPQPGIWITVGAKLKIQL